MCCDEVAVAATGRRIAYAGALQLAACKRLQAKRAAGALAAAMGGNRMTTLDRVRNILGLSVAHEPMRWWPAGLLAVLVPLLVWFGLVGGPRPAQGENPADGAPSATAPGTAGENTAVEKEKDAISPGAAAQSTPTLNEIHQAWKTRQDRIHSARFEWTETRLIAKRTMPPAGYLERLGTNVPPGSKPGEWLPSDDLTVECSRTVSLNGNMMRVTRQGQYWNPIHARVLTDPYLASFDGEIAITFFAGTGPTGPIYPPVGFITKTDRNGDWNNEGLLPIMLAARPCDIYMGGRDLSNFDENSKMGTIDGHECVILTGWNSAREETLWLDVRRGYIVLRMVRSIGAQHDVTFDISYREDPPHGWLPSGWKQVSAGRPTTERPAGRLMYQVVAKVTKREVNVDIPRSEFQFDFPAGTKVRDRRTEGATKSTEAVPVQPAKSAANAKPAATKATAKPPAAAPETESYTFPISLSGRAVDLDGKPIRGAKVYIASPRVESKRLAETVTNEQGRYEFRDVPLPIERVTTNRRRDSGAFEVFGQAAGYGFAWRPLKWFYPKPNFDTPGSLKDRDLPVQYQVGDKIELDLKFPPPATLHGRVVDDRGQPIAGTRLAIRYCDPIPPDGYPNEQSFQRIRGGWSFDSLNESESVPPEIKVRQTGADGRFEFTGLPPDCRFSIDVRPPGFSTRSISAATCDQRRTGLQGLPILVGEMKLTFVRPREVPVLVLYGDSRKPAPNVFVDGSQKEASSWQTSGNDGRATLRLPPGEFKLSLLPATGSPYLRTDGTLQVPESPPKEPIVFLLRPAAAVEVRVVDADTGQGLADVDLWCEKTFQRSPDSPPEHYREVHSFRSWEVGTHLVHSEEPRTNADGVLRALFEPGKHRIGVGKESFPKGYEVVERDGTEFDGKVGEPVRLTFHLRKRR